MGEAYQTFAENYHSCGIVLIWTVCLAIGFFWAGMRKLDNLGRAVLLVVACFSPLWPLVPFFFVGALFIGTFAAPFFLTGRLFAARNKVGPADREGQGDG